MLTILPTPDKDPSKCILPLSSKSPLPRAEGALHVGFHVTCKPKGHTLISLGFSLETSYTAFILPPYHTHTHCDSLTLPTLIFPPPWTDVREKWGLNLAKGFSSLTVFSEDLPRAIVLKILVCAGFFGDSNESCDPSSKITHLFVSTLSGKQNLTVEPWLRTSVEVDKKVSFLVVPSGIFRWL